MKSEVNDLMDELEFHVAMCRFAMRYEGASAERSECRDVDVGGIVSTSSFGHSARLPSLCLQTKLEFVLKTNFAPDWL